MPVYEYQCSRCGGRIEEIQKFSDEPLKKHGGCGGRLKRLLSAPAIQFKGTGWYITDYARKGGGGDGKDGKKDAGPETKPESKTGGSGESAESKKAESKPAPKATKS